MTREDQQKQLDKIMELPRTKRWRAAHDFARSINPAVKQQQDAQKQAIKEIRREQRNDFASGKKSNMRFAVSIPELTWYVLCAVDQGLTDPRKQDENRSDGTNKLVRSLAKTFPEYRVYRRI